MTGRVFVDSNVWIYFFTGDDNLKGKIAREYISESVERRCAVISYQVVNEVCCVLKKQKYAEYEIRRVAEDMMGLCEVCVQSRDVIFLASELREKYSFSYWDSQVVASALISRCDVLASEDMQDGLKINDMCLVNVFASDHMHN